VSYAVKEIFLTLQGEGAHAGPAERPVGDRKDRRLDDMGSHVQACAEAENRPGILRDVGLEESDFHFRGVPRMYE